MTTLIRNVVTIIALVVGVIVGSLAQVQTTIVPKQVQVETNKDVKLIISKDNTKMGSTYSIQGKDMLPIHYNGSTFKYSPTLLLEDLTDTGAKENYIYDSLSFKIDKSYENLVLQAEIVLDNDCALNNAIRVMFMCNGETYTIDKETSSVVLENATLSKTNIDVRIWIWYELEDENVSIENINNAEETNMKLNFYAYAKE